MSLFAELKRRNVFRVGLAYLIVAWLLLQVADLVLENIGAPVWIMQVFMLAVAIGFPIALIFAWAFEMTPEGIKREAEVDRSQSIAPRTGKKLNRLIIAVMAMVIVFLLVDRFFLQGRAPTQAAPSQEVIVETRNAKSIAVLPFADLSQGQDQRWFADGLAEEILNALARAPDLLVSSRTSSFKYRGAEIDIPQIAEELGVAHVLEGSVRGGSDRIRVTAQLIRAGDGFHVWSENYDRDVEDMIGIQEDLARSIAQALETTMDPAALAEMTRAGTRSVAAYEQYLRGIEKRNAPRTSEDSSRVLYRESYEHFEEARRLDPGFARAHEQASEYWHIQLTPSRISFGGTDATVAERLDAFIERIDLAIQHAANPADRTLFLARKLEVELRLTEALRMYRDYVRDHPNDFDGIGPLIRLAVMTSRPEAASEAMETAREWAKNEPQAAIDYLNLAHRVLGAEQAADSVIELADHYLNRAGFQYQAHRTLAWAGRYADARRIYDRHRQMVRETHPLLEARQACMDGDRAKVEALLNGLDDDDATVSSSRWQMLSLLGRDAEAADVLRPLEAQGPVMLRSFLLYPQFDPRPFPSLMTVLEREGIDRPPPVEIPFKCPAPEETSIAVLPFVNMSAAAENEFFSDGISEEILNVLARIPELKVAARTSAFAYKGSSAKVSDIARELGVSHVLEGSVRRMGDQVRITAQLIKADDGFHLWSDSYDRRLENVFAIQDEIAQSIAGTLKLELGLEAGRTGNLTGTNSIEAYEHYLQGMSLWHQRTLGSLREALQAFSLAVDLDPDFAKAHAGRAIAWAVLPGYTPMDMETAYRNIQAAADAALQLDPDSAESLAALGLLSRYQRQYRASAEFFERAIEINPSFASAYQWHATLKADLGDTEGALETMQRAHSLDPRSRIIGYNLSWRLMSTGQLAAAMKVTSDVIAMATDFPETVGQFMMLSVIAGDCAEVERLASRLAGLLGKQVDSTPVYVKLCQRDDPQARRDALNTLTGWKTFDYANPGHPALSYAYQTWYVLIELGEFDALFDSIETVTDDVLEAVPDLRSWDTENGRRLRCDPRFQALERDLDLPPAMNTLRCA